VLLGEDVDTQALIAERLSPRDLSRLRATCRGARHAAPPGVEWRQATKVEMAERGELHALRYLHRHGWLGAPNGLLY
jgi:hypothetical protein